jgi:hypothetical protein
VRWTPPEEARDRDRNHLGFVRRVLERDCTKQLRVGCESFEKTVFSVPPKHRHRARGQPYVFSRRAAADDVL